MVRMARIVLPGVPYHVTHRGNRRRDVFFCDRDRQLYLADLAAARGTTDPEQAYKKLTERDI